MRIKEFIDDKWRQLKTTQIIVLFFVLVILIGTLTFLHTKFAFQPGKEVFYATKS